MDSLIKVFDNFGSGGTVVIFLLFLSAIFGLIEIIKKIRTYLDEYYHKRSHYEKKDINLNNRLTRLEDSEQDTKKSLHDISLSISELRKIIEAVQDNQNRSNIATCRSAMYRLASELIKKQWMTQSEADTLTDLLDVYMRSGAEAKPSVVTRAQLLPVLTEEEIRLKLAEENQ